MKLISVISGFLLWPVVLFAGNDKNCHRSTEGTDFWFGFMENRIYKEEYHTIQITVTALKTTDFRVTVGPPGVLLFDQSFNVFANSSLTIEIPWKIAETTSSEEIQYKGIHLTSVEPVSVFAINWDPNSTDISPVYPLETLGKAYFAMCYEPHIDPDNPLTGNGRNSEFLIVATENQTTVKITPSKVTDQLVPKDSTFEVVLNKGEVFQVQSENVQGSNKNGQGDLTGSRVEADKPVAFFSGALSTTIPNSQCCWDHLFEQIPPVQSWGYEYYTVPLKTRIKDRFRILASKNNTTVQISGEPLLYLNEGEFHEFEFEASEAKQIISDKPVLVAQFSQSNNVDKLETGGNGDPFMIILNPAGRGVNTAIFSTFDAPLTVPDTAYIGIKRNFVNIVALTVEEPNIQLDGKSVSGFQPYNVGPWSFAQIEIPKGTHIVENVAGTDGFVAYVYGFGGYESYGFGTGFNFDLTLELGENIEFFKGDTLLLCNGDTLKLDAGPQFISYKWSTGETTQTIDVTSEGELWVEVISESGCQLNDTVFVFSSKPTVDLGERYNEVCYPQKLLLNGGNGFEKYTWQNEFNDTISTLQSITAESTGEYRLTVFDHFRCAARDSFGLTVFPVPEIEITGDHLICGTNITQLFVSVTGIPDSIWDYHDSYDWFSNSPDINLSDEGLSAVHCQAGGWGNYDIFFRLVTIDNCVTTDTFKIKYHPQPISDFTFEDDTLCEGYSKRLNFTGLATDSAFFDWNLDGCQFVDTFDLQKRIYSISVGTFQQKQPQISLVINDNGCVSDTVEKLLNAKPNFVMEADKVRGCDSLTVSLTSELLTPDNVEFVWTFDDTEIVRLQNVTRNYPDTGFYKVNLSITNPVTKCQNGFTIDSMIKVFPTPVAEISADTTLCYPGSALLVYTHHIDSSLCIWEFNGNQLSGFNYDSVTMIMDNPFENIKLTVNEYGCVSAPVEMNLKRKPNFDFYTEREEGCQPYSFGVFAETTDNFIDFSWVTDSLPYPKGISNLVYLPDTGRFDITLIAYSNETGCADALLKPDWIWVHRNPNAKFEVDFQAALLENSTITFTNYTERAENYFWDFGDNITSEEFEPVHTYKQLGEYTASLYAESVFGCADTFELGIKIIPSTVYTPNAFSPDSEIPENRTFMPVGAGADDSRFNLKIFNRWGELIFETNSLYNPWDGTLKNGENAPMGNYVWISNYFDIQGLERYEKGQIMLIR